MRIETQVMYQRDRGNENPWYNKLSPEAPFTNMDQLLSLAWISDHMPSKVWDELTYPFPNFNGCTIEVQE